MFLGRPRFGLGQSVLCLLVQFVHNPASSRLTLDLLMLPQLAGRHGLPSHYRDSRVTPMRDTVRRPGIYLGLNLAKVEMSATLGCHSPNYLP